MTSNYYRMLATFETDESPIRTSFPVSTVPITPPVINPTPPSRPTNPKPPQSGNGSAGGTKHDPLCITDLRKTLDIYIK